MGVRQIQEPKRSALHCSTC